MRGELSAQLIFVNYHYLVGLSFTHHKIIVNELLDSFGDSITSGNMPPLF